jgi:hypothetical protein
MTNSRVVSDTSTTAPSSGIRFDANAIIDGGFVSLSSLAGVHALRWIPGTGDGSPQKGRLWGRLQNATLPHWQNLASGDQG